jgi:flagella basal body P-ring formation protein FlgA
MKTLLATLLLSFASLAQAQADRQDPAVLKGLVEQFLQQQTAGLPGKATVTVGNIDPRMSLAACAAPEAFQMPGSKPWGKVSVGVRCALPTPWTVYIQANISVIANYVVTAAPLAQGQAIEAGQLAVVQGDLAALPNGVITDTAMALGRMPTVSLPAGMPLRADNLKSKPVVQQGQQVRLVTYGKGFSISADGKAIANATDGQVVQVRTPNGSIVAGVARSGGLVEISI